MGKIVDLVDRGFQLSTSIKKSEAELDEIKRSLKIHAKKYKKPVVEGNKAKALVQPMSFTSISPKALYDYLAEQGRESEFFGLVKVKITNTSKSLGEVAVDHIGDTTTLDYHKIQFKKLK